MLNSHHGAGCSSFPQSNSQSFRGWADSVSLSAFLPLSPHKYANHGYQEETFHTKSRQTGGISTVSSLQGEKNELQGKENLIKGAKAALTKSFMCHFADGRMTVEI